MSIPFIFFKGAKNTLPQSSISSITIMDCGEPLVELKMKKVIISKTKKRLNFDKNNSLFAREGAVSRLEKATNFLPTGLSFKVFDAYRPYEFQKSIFDIQFNLTKSENPNMSDSQIQKIVFNRVFPPSKDPNKPAPHMTGGAFDLTLVDTNLRELDMGCKYEQFDQFTPTNYSNLSLSQKENRLILLESMIEAGFANFPAEWWHFMYGDQEWAAYMNLATCSSNCAKYGGVILDN